MISQHAGTPCLGFDRSLSQTTALKQSKNVPGIYVANIEGRQNSSPILMGLTNYFERHMSSVGFFQPVCLKLSTLLMFTFIYIPTFMPPLGVWGTVPKFNHWVRHIDLRASALHCHARILKFPLICRYSHCHVISSSHLNFSVCICRHV